MRIAAIIQARMGSTRFPGKILAPLIDRPILSIIRERTREAKVDSWWLATTSQEQDDLTELWAKKLELTVYRGDVEDVLSRFTAIVHHDKPDWIVRLTADDPFVDEEIINILIKKAKSAPASVMYFGMGKENFLPLGYVPEIVRAESLLQAEAQIPQNMSYHKCHVTSWVKQNMNIGFLDIPDFWKARGHWRWTVDTMKDYEMASRAFEMFGNSWTSVRYSDMVSLLDQHPETTEINLNVEQKSIEEG